MRQNILKISFIIILIIIYKHQFLVNYYNEIYFPTFKELDKELNDIQEYMNIIFNKTLIDGARIFNLTNNPKISIIITVYNGEAYLNTSLISIQNQDFKDIEIIMIDDCSSDNSINLIKELMIKEPRIVLYKNIINKGMLYTKIKGIKLAKGKYILLLDEDDIFVQRDALSILYKEAKKNNLDLLGYNLIFSGYKLKKIQRNRTKVKNHIIYQPELSEQMFRHTSDGKIKKIGGLLTTYLIKKNILIKVINKIDKKLLDSKMNFHDDFVLFFLLTRYAFSLKKIDRIFYVVFSGWNKTNQKITFRLKEKERNRKYMRCNSLLNYNEFILKNTKNTTYDKKVAFFCLDKYLLSYWCRNYTPTFEKAKKISNIYLNNEYIEEKDKNKIKEFLNEINKKL